MAARNSCTHMTWAEAKAKVGGNNGPGKKKPIPKKVTHSEALLHKVIAKNGGTQEAVSQGRAELRKQRRGEERAVAAAAKRAEERERERAEQSTVKPYEQSAERLKEVAAEQQAAPAGEATKCTDTDLSEMKNIAQCIEMQLDEILALEAIFMDTDQFLVSEASTLEEARSQVEEWQMDEDNENLLRSVVGNPPVCFTLQLTIDDERGGGDMNLGAHVLLRVELPPRYPLHGAVPNFSFAYFMVTDKEATCSADKPLVSLAYLDETKLLQSMEKEAEEMQPDPCVYELASTWLSESLFDYVVMHSHGNLATK